MEEAIALSYIICMSRYRLQIEMPALFSLSSVRSLSMTTRKKVEERTEPKKGITTFMDNLQN